MALFHLLVEVGQPMRVLHFQHDGQSEFAERSREFCERLCAENQVEIVVESVHGRPLEAAGDLSWEAACRHLRYKSLLNKEGLFLTAHTADDQAETVVMRLLGGSGLAGLGGVYPIRDDGVARPLLSFSRDELRGYLEENDRTWVEDPTNLDGNERALIRSEIMPVLKTHQPALLSILGRTSRRLREDEDFLRSQTYDWMEKHGSEQGDSWDLSVLRGLARPLLVRFLTYLFRVMSGSRFRPRATLLEEAAKLLERGSNEAHVKFPGGWSLWVLGEKVWICPSLEEQEWSHDVWRDGVVYEGLQVSRVPRPDWTAWRAPEGSVLRSRRPGDKFQGRSVKKLLVGTGHPPWVRNRWPMLVQGNEVLAIYGRPALEEVTNSPEIWVQFQPTRLRATVRPPEK